jgi:diaminopimelate decarboxylase
MEQSLLENRSAAARKPNVIPSLPAIKGSLARQLLDDHSDTLKELVDGLGSPLHLVFPQVFAENVVKLKDIFRQAGVASTIFFAKKSNKATCFAKGCVQTAIGMDVVSVGELEKALAAGIPGDRIGVSGPAKARNLIHLALHHRCLIAVDCIEELFDLRSIAQESCRRARIILRCQIPSQPDSRFGLSSAELEAALDICRGDGGVISLLGFSFHLSGYRSDERARAAARLVDLCVKARSAGLKDCHYVNIGGGLAVQYVEPKAWANFLHLDAPQNYHAKKKFDGFYPYGGERAGADALADILAFQIDGVTPLSTMIRRNGIRLIIEPGRALLDQAGLTAFRVQGVKDRTATMGYAILVAQGSSFNLSEQWFNSEYLPDLTLIPAWPRAQKEFFACVGGATCLESDMLTWRKIRFNREIKAGDLIVYHNTAGYQMDSNESPFHEAKLPHKAVIEIENAQLRWALDDVA